jgi:GxxExxY protein
MSHHQLIEEQLTRSVIGAFYDVYNTLGFGFLEQVYMVALERELRRRGHSVGREVYVSVSYKGEEIARQRIDMIVDERLVVEAKATQELHKSASRQVYNYLRATRLQIGLMLHFGPEPRFHRLVCSESEHAPIRGNRSNAPARGIVDADPQILRGSASTPPRARRSDPQHPLDPPHAISPSVLDAGPSPGPGASSPSFHRPPRHHEHHDAEQQHHHPPPQVHVRHWRDVGGGAASRDEAVAREHEAEQREQPADGSADVETFH